MCGGEIYANWWRKCIIFGFIYVRQWVYATTLSPSHTTTKTHSYRYFYYICTFIMATHYFFIRLYAMISFCLKRDVEIYMNWWRKCIIFYFIGVGWWVDGMVTPAAMLTYRLLITLPKMLASYRYYYYRLTFIMATHYFIRLYAIISFWQHVWWGNIYELMKKVYNFWFYLW